MNKQLFTLAVLTSLTACGGGSGGSSSSDSDTSPTSRDEYKVKGTSYSAIGVQSDAVSISSIEVEGNAEYIFNGRTNIVQVHANIDDGEFIVEVDGQFGAFADRDAEIRLVFSDDNISSRDVLEDSSAIYDGVIYDNLDDVSSQGLRTICQYESLSSVTCGGITIDLSEDETQLPAHMNLHALSCDAAINVCEYGAYVRIQLN